jgi:glycosyltransferase involved in cell wall biosynthesis
MDRLMSMRVFQRVIDEGGFAAAARALDLSPAVVTRLVADLEDHLGTRLLHRTTRRLSLSEAGEAYLARVRVILQDIDEAHVMASAHTQELAEKVAYYLKHDDKRRAIAEKGHAIFMRRHTWQARIEQQLLPLLQLG